MKGKKSQIGKKGQMTLFPYGILPLLQWEGREEEGRKVVCFAPFFSPQFLLASPHQFNINKHQNNHIFLILMLLFVKNTEHSNELFFPFFAEIVPKKSSVK